MGHTSNRFASQVKKNGPAAGRQLHQEVLMTTHWENSNHRLCCERTIGLRAIGDLPQAWVTILHWWPRKEKKVSHVPALYILPLFQEGKAPSQKNAASSWGEGDYQLHCSASLVRLPNSASRITHENITGEDFVVQTVGNLSGSHLLFSHPPLGLLSPFFHPQPPCWFSSPRVSRTPG